MFTLVDVCAVIFCLLMSYALVYSVVENLSYLNKIDKKTYKDLTIKEAFEKSVFLNKLKNTDMAKFLNGSLKRKIEKSP
jgi:hypothetical protein